MDWKGSPQLKLTINRNQVDFKFKISDLLILTWSKQVVPSASGISTTVELVGKVTLPFVEVFAGFRAEMEMSGEGPISIIGDPYSAREVEAVTIGTTIVNSGSSCCSKNPVGFRGQKVAAV